MRTYDRRYNAIIVRTLADPVAHLVHVQIFYIRGEDPVEQLDTNGVKRVEIHGGCTYYVQDLFTGV